MTRQDIPNLLTHLRMALAFATFAGLLGAAFGAELLPGVWMAAALIFASLGAFALGAVTDFFDGWLARRWGASSAWGAMLDPIADKIAVCAAVIGLIVVQPRLTMAAAGGLILFREMFVSGLREAGAPLGLTFPVTRLAKWKTTLQLTALCAEMAAAGLRVLDVARTGTVTPLDGHIFFAADTLLWLAAAATVWTGAGYTAAALHGLRARAAKS